MTSTKKSSTKQKTSAPDPKDYYALLGIPKSASEDDIKKAYRKMAMKHHPDRNPGDSTAEETFKNVKNAYETLSDADKRATYDRFGADGPQGFSNSNGPSGFSGFTSSGADPFADMFAQFFNQGRGRASAGAGRRPPPPGQDILVQTHLTLEEAYVGKTIQVTIPVAHECTACDATGSKTKSAPTSCDTCGGSGVVNTNQGMFQVQHECPTCHGQGKSIAQEDACNICHGTGHIDKSETVDVKIPAGIDSDMRVRIPGKGRPSGHPQGQAGDLYVQIHVQEHKVFQRDDQDLHVDLAIPWTTAALGGTLPLTLLDGTPLEVNIPEGTQHGQVLRARGRGMPNPRNPDNANERGHLLMRLSVQIPTSLTAEQKRLLKEIDASLSGDSQAHQPSRSSWLDKAKEWLA